MLNKPNHKNFPKNNLKKDNFSFSNDSEIISKIIIEKIIGLSINKVFTNILFNNENFSKYLMTYLRKSIDPLLRLKYMNYDKDDLYEGDKNWSDIIEPKKIKKDVYTLNIVKKEERLNNSTINEIIESNFHLSNDSKTKINKSSSFKMNNYYDNSEIKKEKKKLNLSMPSYKIQDIIIRQEPKEIKILREKFEIELKEKKKQLLENTDSKKRVSQKNKIRKYTKENQIDFNKYSFDPNGKIIRIKGINNKNLIKEFGNVIPKSTFIQNIKQKEDDFYSYYINHKDEIKVETVSAKIDSNSNNKLKKEIKLFKNYIKTKFIPVKQIQGPLKAICPPAGDNFNIFQPEIGVNIKNNDKREKIGSKQYSKLFKRYSLGEFYDIYDETSNINKNKIKYHEENIKNDIKDLSLNLSSISKSSYKKSNSLIGGKSTLNSIEKGTKNSSSGYININQNVLKDNSILFDTIDSLDLVPEVDNKLSYLKKEKNIFKQRISNLNLKNYYQRKNSFNNSRNTKLFSRNSSMDLIDKFNKSLVQDKGQVFEKKYKKYIGEMDSNSFFLPGIKQPKIPNYYQIKKKQNGVLNKTLIPLRVKSKKIK